MRNELNIRAHLQYDQTNPSKVHMSAVDRIAPSETSVLIHALLIRFGFIECVPYEGRCRSRDKHIFPQLRQPT